MALASAMVVVVACMTACSGFQKAKQAAMDSNDMRQIGLAWHSYNDTFQKGPSKAEDLFPFMEGANSPPSQGLKSGKYVLYWDVSMNDLTSTKGAPSTGTVVLGYMADVPSKGGLVVMCDGSIRTMSAAEFAAAKKLSDFKKAPTPKQAVPVRENEVTDLRIIGLAWGNYISTWNKGPARAEDLVPFLPRETKAPSEGLKSGKYVLYWNVSARDVVAVKGAPPTSSIVLGYSATTPTEGGPVLWVDGSVRSVSAAEFAAAKKASDFKKR